MMINSNTMEVCSTVYGLIQEAMEQARIDGSSTLTITFIPSKSKTSFDFHGEVSKSKRVIVQANDKTVDFTYVLDNMGLMPDIMPIGDLIYDARIYRSLKRSNINTVGDLKERFLDSISDERYSAFGYPLFTVRNLGICSAQKVLTIMTETIDAIKAGHTTNSLTPEHPLESKEKCVLAYIDKFDNIPVESLEVSNRVKIVIGRWFYWHFGYYADCVISNLKPLIEEQSWKGVRAFGIKAYEELIDALYLKVVNSGAWILE